MRRPVSGQAMSEALVTLPVLVMILLAGASLYMLMGADTDANKSARLAAWHGVLYNTGNNGLTAQQLNQRIERNLATTILDRDRRDFGQPTGSPLVKSIRPGDGQLGLRTENIGDAAANYPTSNASQLGARAGLTAGNQMVGVSVSIPVNGNADLFKSATWQNGDYRESGGIAPIDPVSGKRRAHVDARAVLVTNGMMPVNEDTFTEAVESVSADGDAFKVFQPVAPLLNGLGFDEMAAALGDDGRSTVAGNQSNTLPTQLGQFRE